ncbi:MAG: hypothetical protein VX612_04890 [Pseudomonadota bacterium]|nr:hypothetical protein [Pseudomonadota bacterium]
MSRNMWILGAVLLVFVLTMFYQSEFGGGIERPWMECKESMMQQIMSGACTPRDGVYRPPARN